MTELPRGTVTFLFTDIEGSTRRWEHDHAAMARALARHDTLLRDAIAAGGGTVFKTIGDAVCAAFATAPAALAAALSAQRALAAETWDETGPLRVRMALHTATATPHGGDYAGPPLNRVARLLAAGHGGQVCSPRPSSTWSAPTCWPAPRCATWASTGCATCWSRSASFSSSLPTWPIPSHPCAASNATRRICRCSPRRSSAATRSWLTSKRCWHATTCGW